MDAIMKGECRVGTLLLFGYFQEIVSRINSFFNDVKNLHKPYIMN